MGSFSFKDIKYHDMFDGILRFLHFWSSIYLVAYEFFLPIHVISRSLLYSESCFLPVFTEVEFVGMTWIIERSCIFPVKKPLWFVLCYPYCLTIVNSQEYRGIRSSFTLDFYKKAYDHIVEHYPYWERSSGKNHIWVWCAKELLLSYF